MEILDLKKTPIKKVVTAACQVLKKGGLLVYPTETCYGLGVDATNPTAVQKLLDYKGARAGKAISIAVADQAMAENYVHLNPAARNLYQNFLPGPLTVVSQSRGRVVPQLESHRHTLGIRIPDYPLVLKIIKAFGKPITSTSANTSNRKPPYSLKDFLKYTSQRKLEMIDFFLDAGRLPPRPPSTVVDTTLHEPRVLRQGEIKIPALTGHTFISTSEAQTHTLARQIFEKHRRLLSSHPLIFALQGELGAGKTQFVKGLAQALGITQNVPSPTFVLVRQYPYQLKDLSGYLYHLDTWRLASADELYDLGFKKMLQPKNVIAIEWLQKVRSILDHLSQTHPVIWVDITILSPKKRQIKYLSTANLEPPYSLGHNLAS